MTYTELFRNTVQEKINKMILPFIDLTSGDIHREVGGYPAADGKHHMPCCCEAMYSMMKGNDEVISAPPSGKGATVTIRYYKHNHK